MTHDEITAALRGDYRSDSNAERHNCYLPIKKTAGVTDPRPPLKPVPSLQRWI